MAAESSIVLDSYRRWSTTIADMTDGRFSTHGPAAAKIAWNTTGASNANLSALAADLFNQTGDIGLIINTLGSLERFRTSIEAATDAAAVNKAANNLYGLLTVIKNGPTPVEVEPAPPAAPTPEATTPVPGA